jgi:hypothetical protein
MFQGQYVGSSQEEVRLVRRGGYCRNVEALLKQQEEHCRAYRQLMSVPRSASHGLFSWCVEVQVVDHLAGNLAMW